MIECGLQDIEDLKKLGINGIIKSTCRLEYGHTSGCTFIIEDEESLKNLRLRKKYLRTYKTNVAKGNLE